MGERQGGEKRGTGLTTSSTRTQREARVFRATFAKAAAPMKETASCSALGSRRGAGAALPGCEVGTEGESWAGSGGRVCAPVGDGVRVAAGVTRETLRAMKPHAHHNGRGAPVIDINMHVCTPLSGLVF